MIRREYAILLTIFIVAFLIRIWPALTYEYNLGLDSHYHIRMAKTILESGIPSYDELSFGGRPYNYLPGIHIALTAFTFGFIPVEIVAKVLPTLVGSLAIVGIFLLTKKFYGVKAGLIAAAFLAFVPVNIWKTASNTLVSAFDITFLIFALYFALEGKTKYFAATVIITAIFSPFVAFFEVLLGMTVFLKYKDIKPKIFCGVFILGFLVFGIVFSSNYENIYLSKNIPDEIRILLYENIDFPTFLYRINPFVFAFGAAGLILTLKLKKYNSLLLAWLILISVLSIALFLETDRGLFYLAPPLCIYAGYLLSSVKKEKIFYTVLAISIIFSFAISIEVINNMNWGRMSNQEHETLVWIRDNTPENSTVLASLTEGHWVSNIAERKNVIDPNLLGAPNLNERYEDVKTIVSTQNKEEQKNLLNKYDIDYIFVSDNYYGLKNNRLDFPVVYQNGNNFVFSVG